jgi:hypothetical protein
MCSIATLTVEVPAPDEPVMAMIGWRFDIPNLFLKVKKCQQVNPLALIKYKARGLIYEMSE